MKLANSLGLAMLATVALIALGGVGSASASALCESNENPCAKENLIANGTELKASLESPEQVVLKSAFGPKVSCQSSSLVGELTLNPSTTQILAEITKASFTECSIGMRKCTVTAIHLPWEMHIDQDEEQTGDGIVWIGPKPEGLQPGFKLEACNALTGCVYETQEFQPGYETEWIELFFAGGMQPTLSAEQSQLKSIGCARGFLDAKYLVTPKPAWVNQI
jgi:hypothetical protein